MTTSEVEFATFRALYFTFFSVCEEYWIVLMTVLELGDLSLYSDNRGQVPIKSKRFFLRKVQTGSGDHTASSPMSAEDCFCQ
jgi:hypothetical protein